jgi:hypothetical protein
MKVARRLIEPVLTMYVQTVLVMVLSNGGLELGTILV